MAVAGSFQRGDGRVWALGRRPWVLEPLGHGFSGSCRRGRKAAMISTQILRYFPHFSGLEEDALGQIASISDKKEFDAGEELFTEGDRASHFCLLRAGQVNIVYRLGDGQTVVADTLGSGGALGWSAFVEPHRLPASFG